MRLPPACNAWASTPAVDPAVAAATVPATIAVQGNLDPLALVAGGEHLEAGVRTVLDAWRGRPAVFNLGHGIVPRDAAGARGRPGAGRPPCLTPPRVRATYGCMQRTRLAVVLFNLGGPDTPAAVRPFLVNLFRDPAILRVPFFVRPLLARIIAYARTKPATANYQILGGGSPLLRLTEEQARALEAELPEFDVRCFVAMRYWHPFSDDVARMVQQWGPDEVVLLPLYPQYSTTTTGSSLSAWRDAAAQANLVAPVTTLCCYHADPGYVSATADGSAPGL